MQLVKTSGMTITKYVQLGIALFLMATIVAGISYVAYLAIFDYGEVPNEPYLTPHSKDTTRILASTPSEVSSKVTEVMFPVNRQPNSSITIPDGSWSLGIAFAPLSKWVNAPILIDGEQEPALGQQQQQQQQQPPSPRVVINGTQMTEEEAAAFPSEPIAAAAQVDSYITANFAENLSSRIVITPLSENEHFALIAAGWSSFSGDPFLYINEDSVPAETSERLEARKSAGVSPSIYIIAPSGIVSDSVISQLSEYGRVIVPDLGIEDDPFTASMKFAVYRDFDTGFGWGMDRSNEFGSSKAGYFNYIVVNPDHIGMGVVAIPLAHSAKFGPILYTYPDYITPVVDNYLWETKADFFVTPAEGPFNHYWIIGDPATISYIVQSRFDYGTEIGAYRMQGAGMSSLEALFAGWVAFSIAGAIYVGVSMRKSLKSTPLLQKLAWPLVVLMLGPFGLVAYWLSFSGRRMMEHKTPDGIVMAMWERPPWVQAMVATMTAVAFAGSTMIATAWLLELFFGLPLTVIGGPLYWFGNGMILTIAISYTITLLVSWLVFQGPMFAMQRKQPFRKVIKPALVAVIVSMTAVSLGMMSLMYFMHMWWLPMLPEEDDLAWMGSTFFATTIGAVLAMPPNYALVKRGIKVGEM